MRKSSPFFVTTWSMLLFLGLTFTVCGRIAIPSSAGAAPAPTRYPNQVYALARAPDRIRLARGTKKGDIQFWFVVFCVNSYIPWTCYNFSWRLVKYEPGSEAKEQKQR